MVAVAETQPRIFDLFGRDIRIPVADTLVVFADVGFDIFQLFVDALGRDALARGLVSFRIPECGRYGQLATELRDRTVDRDTPHDGGFAVLLGLSFQIEQDFESASCHNSNNFTVNTLNRVICCW